jgi:hypothetical protein
MHRILARGGLKLLEGGSQNMLFALKTPKNILFLSKCSIKT